MGPINANSWQSIQREEVLALVKFRELKDNTNQNTQPQQTKDNTDWKGFKGTIVSEFYSLCMKGHLKFRLQSLKFDIWMPGEFKTGNGRKIVICSFSQLYRTFSPLLAAY